MDNLSFANDRSKKKTKKVDTFILVNSENTTSIAEVLTKCDDLIKTTDLLYSSKQNKDLYDAIITLHSVRKSFEIVSLN